MKKIFLLFTSLLLLTSCQKDVDFLYRQPDPPPAPQKPMPPQIQHHAKKYSLDVAYTNIMGAQVDILWMIDNSSSMGTSQSNVIKNTALFMQNFTSQSLLEWRMGLISSDLRDVPYVGFGNSPLDWTTPNPVNTFQNAVSRLGLGGDTDEKTADTVMKALKEHPEFLRPDAFFALIVVTDEDDTSHLSTEEFVRNLVALKGGDPSHVLVFGAYGTRQECGFDGFDYTYSRYKKLMDLTNSTKFSLCAPDFGKVLSDLGSNLVQQISVISPTIALEYRPVVSTIKVTYQGKVLKPGGASVGGDWTYDPVYNLVRINDASTLSASARDIEIEFDIDMDFYKN